MVSQLGNELIFHEVVDLKQVQEIKRQKISSEQISKSENYIIYQDGESLVAINAITLEKQFELKQTKLL